MTEKEDVVARGFLSQETVDLLKKYLETLPNNNPYLFPSSRDKPKPISRTQMGNLLKDLAQKAGLKINKNKSLTFHCFRKMLLSASIDSGIGLTAGKKLVGKTIPQSDDTYLTTVKLRELFLQLKKFLTINEKPKVETETIETLKKAVTKLQEDLTLQKQITKTISEENLKIKQELGRIQPVIDFVNTYNTVKEQQELLEFTRAKSKIELSSYNPNIILDKTIEREMNEIAKKEGISKALALTKIADKHWDKFVENDKKRIKSLKERGVPVTKEDYKKRLEEAIKQNPKMKEKYQRRLDKLNNPNK
jgi:hypothetical protein